MPQLTERELGFGTAPKTNRQQSRVINADGSSNIVRLNAPRFKAINIYHDLISYSWRKFMALTVFAYVGINCIFAIFYEIIGLNHLAGLVADTAWGRFLEAFFFSTQTFTTVGYGRVNPVGVAANCIAALESLTGLLFFALVTGLLYGRFSRPSAKFIYSQNMLVAPYKTTPTALMFRFANARKNQLIEVEVQLIMAYDDTTAAGETKRKFVALPLEISKINFLNLSWTVVHPIDAASPLIEINAATLPALNPEFLIMIKGIDDTYAQFVYHRRSYTAHDVVWNARFVSIISQTDAGKMAVDLANVSAFEKV
jgi:inward rectifier potassium channel